MSKPGFVIAATGLAAEARIAARSKSVVTCVSGGREERLRAALNAAISDAALGIISFGIAGALAPELRSGDIVIGTAVVAQGHIKSNHDNSLSPWGEGRGEGAVCLPNPITAPSSGLRPTSPQGEKEDKGKPLDSFRYNAVEGKMYEANCTWRDRLSVALPSSVRSVIFGSPIAIGEPDAKAALYRATGAVAADMESQVVAQFSEERGLPFAILRVIADSANERLPPAAIAGLKLDGTPDIVAVLKSVAGDPTQLADLIRVAFATRRAMAGLFRCHRLLGPGLGFADLG